MFWDNEPIHTAFLHLETPERPFLLKPYRLWGSHNHPLVRFLSGGQVKDPCDKTCMKDFTSKGGKKVVGMEEGGLLLNLCHLILTHA